MASFPDCDQLVYDTIVAGFEGDDSRQSSQPPVLVIIEQKP